MPGGWPVDPSYANAQSLGGIAGTSNGTVVTSSATTFTKGAWTQLIASTPNDITRLHLTWDVAATNGPTMGLDLAIAPSGSEASGIVIQNLVVAAFGGSCETVDLPVTIPAGSRVAARFQSATGSDTITVQVVGYDSGYAGYQGPGLFDTYGWAGTGNALGIAIDPGATANTKGAYAQLSASTSNDLRGFFLGFDSQNILGTTSINGTVLLDLALGASGSEKIIVPNCKVCHNLFSGGVQIGPNYSPFIPMPIKAGTRIAARAQSGNNTSGTRTIGISLYGLRA